MSRVLEAVQWAVPVCVVVFAVWVIVDAWVSTPATPVVSSPDTAVTAAIDMTDTVVEPDRPLSKAELAALDPTLPPDSHRVVVPELGINIPLGEISTLNGAAVAVDFTSVYRFRDFGVRVTHAREGALFLVTHTSATAVAPGNLLFSPQGHPVISGGMTIRITAPAGDAASDLTYTVTGVYDLDKHRLQYDALWKAGPGELVLLTTLPSAHAVSDKNLVVTARLHHNSIGS